MAGTVKPSREDELRALRGTLSGEQLQAVHDFWLEQGIDPDLESHAGDSLMSVLREAEGGLAELGRLDAAFERLADEVAHRTGVIRAELARGGDARGNDVPTASPEVPADAKDSVEIAPETTRTIHPAANSAPITASSVGPASVAAATEATFLSNPNTGDDGPPQLTQRDGGLATPTEAELVPGFQLGAYRIVKRLGQGGMGSVFVAEHIRMERQVALKTLSSAMSRDPQAVKRFHREVKAAAKLTHANIVTAYDADEARGLQMLVMEYVDGSDLSVRVKKDGALPLKEAVDCVLQAARGLEFAHSKGVVHRDIKPANLLQDKAGVVKVLDMGLARIGEFDESASAGLTSTGTIMGTAEFMAPEQALDTRTAGAPADIYSLGCTLYYLLTGKAPFTGDTVMKILLAHRDRAVPKLGDVRADVPDRLDRLFQRMIAKRVEDRCQSMAEVITELEAMRAELLTGSVLNPGSGPVSLAEAVEEMSRSQATAPTRKQRLPVAMPVARGVAPPARKFSRGLIAAASAAAVILFGLVITLKTREGKLILKVDDADVTVEVDEKEEKFTVTDKEGKTLTIGVDPGKHRLVVRKGGIKAYSNSFEIGWGGSQTLEATLVPVEQPPAVAVDMERAGIGPTKAPRTVATKLFMHDPAFPQWLKDVQSLPAEQQLEAVSKKLMELNPGFDGKLRGNHVGTVPPMVANGVVTELQLSTTNVSDISPLRSLVGLTTLYVSGSEGGGDLLTDLAPLEGMSLSILGLDKNKNLSDISPLNGMPLMQLSLWFCPKVRDLTPIRGMRFLHNLVLSGTAVSDLSALADIKSLRMVALNNCTAVTDLSPLRGIPLESLDITVTGANDVSVLKELPLKKLYITFNPDRDTALLRAIKTLETINHKPAAEFWKDVKKMSASASATQPVVWDTPEFQKWLTEVKGLPAAKLLEAVSRKMVELNPGFDGKLAHPNSNIPAVTPVIERGQVVEVGFASKEVTNIAPLRAFGTLRTLVCLGTPEGNERGRLADLSPLRGMEIERFYADWNPLLRDISPVVGPRLRELRVAETGVTDLSPLRGSALTTLNMSFCGVTDIQPLAGLPLETLNLAYYGAEGGVTDLSPLQGMPLKELRLRSNIGLTDISGLAGLPLTSLDLLQTGVESLEPLRGMRLTTISIGATKVSDMSPLKAMPLKVIELEFDAARDTEWLRSIKTLESINGKPVAEFLKGVAAMSAKSPKPAVPQPDSGKNDWNTPEFRQWLADVKDLPAAMLLDAVEKKLAELNPGFDGKLSHPFSHIPGPSPVIERGKVVEVGFSSQSVKNIAPLRAFGKLRALSCAGSSDPAQQPSSLVDLSPLRGMEIERLAVCWNQKLSDISPAVWPGLRELLANDSKVADLTPLRGTPLRKLLVDFSGVVDLSPLEGMPLEELGVSGDIGKTPGVSDLSPLKGMRLTFLSIAQNSSLSDISALAGMPLDWLVATGTIIDSLEPLRGIKLRQLALIRTRVTDLSPLKDMPLEALELNSTPVSDLTPLQSLPLTELNLSGCDALSDCSPLKGMSLKRVFLDFDAERDTEWLRSLEDLEQINGKPVAEFWKEVEGM